MNGTALSDQSNTFDPTPTKISTDRTSKSFILWSKIIAQCHSLLDCYRILCSIAMGTHHHLAVLNKSGSHMAPLGPIPIFLRGIDSSVYPQTFLLDDLL